MSDANFAFLACPADLGEPAAADGWLAQVADAQDGTNAAGFIAVTTRFKASRGIRTFNVGVGYPAELAELATHAHWAEAGPSWPRQYRDAQALFCLHRFVQAHPQMERIALIVESPGDENDLTACLQGPSSTPFFWPKRDVPASATTGPIIFDRSHPASDMALTLALDIALSGAIYGLAPYSLETLLDQSISAAALVACRVPVGENGLKS